MSETRTATFLYGWSRTRARGRFLYVALSTVLVSLIACAWQVLQENAGIRPTPRAVTVIMLIAPAFAVANLLAIRFPIARWLILIPVALALFYAVPQLPRLPAPETLGEFALGGAIIGMLLGAWAYHDADRRFTKLLAEGAAVPATRPPPNSNEVKLGLLFLLLILAALGPALLTGWFK